MLGKLIVLRYYKIFETQKYVKLDTKTKHAKYKNCDILVVVSIVTCVQIFEDAKENNQLICDANFQL